MNGSGRLGPVAATTLATCVTANVVGVFLMWTTKGSSVPSIDVAFSVIMIVFAAIGFLIAAKRSGNGIGWLFLHVATTSSIATAAEEYGRRALTSTEPLPGGHHAAWLGNWMLGFGITSLALLLLLFPSGRPESRLTRWLTRMAIGLILLFTITTAIDPEMAELGYRAINPFAWPEATALLEPSMGPANGLFVVVVVASVISLLGRALQSHGDMREQFKWFGFAAAILFVFAFPINAAVTTWAPSRWHDLPFVIGLAGLPLATGVAILRYRLYEIDVIINRALVYATLTAILAGAYLLIVFGLQQVLPLGTDSDIAVAASTLAVAALFRPLRGQVQGFIDRRFYRSHYDAAETLARFGARLRDQVDVDHVRVDALDVVATTVQPSHASIWLVEAS